jgi:glycosyltransferase involved in cell wall biosynthesis
VNIVLVSDHEVLGGAAQSTCRLAEGLCRHESVSRVVLHPEGEHHPWRTLPLVREESALRRQALRVPRRIWPARFPRPATAAFAAGQLARRLRRLRPDIVNLHNLHGAATWGWQPELAAVAAQFAPVVWTLHDMWSFTGRCAYSYDCERFRTGCGPDCPSPDEPPRLPAADIAPAWARRRALFRDLPGLVAVTPSRWLAREAQRGLWAGHRVEVIPYGVPTEAYRPLPRAEARRALGLEPNQRVLLLAAVDLTERRKGAQLLPQLWPHLPAQAVTILTMGRGELQVSLPHCKIRPLGWVEAEQTRMLAYNAADALLHPAPVDNFPNVILEALACGTPVIALPIGGVPEMIHPGVTGWLADDATPAALGQAVSRALTDLDHGCDLREPCRRGAESEYTLERQANRYRQLFAELQSPARRATIR